MAKERNALQVGTLTIVVVILIFLVLIWISKGTSGELATVKIRFEPTPAMPKLTKGSAILVGGQTIGQVTKAELRAPERTEKDEPDLWVEVEAEIQKEFAAMLHADCSAVAEGPPLGGDGIIKLDLGKAPEPFDIKNKEDEFNYIRGAQPGGFGAILASLQSEFDGDNPASLLGQIKAELDAEEGDSLMAKLHQSLMDVNAMTASLSYELTSDERKALMAKFRLIASNIAETTGQLRREFDSNESKTTLRKVHLAMDSINSGLTTVTRLLQNTEGSIETTLANVEKTSGHLVAETDPQRPDSLMAHFKQVSTSLNTAMEDIGVVTATARDVVVLNRTNINRVLSNFKESSDHIKTGVKYVLRHPWRLFNEPKLPEMKQQAIFDAARSFAEAATRIDDASAQLRALSDLHGGAIPGDDTDLARIRADLQNTHQMYRKAEAELWRQLGLSS